MFQSKNAAGLISVLLPALIGLPVATGQTRAPEDLRTWLAAELRHLTSRDYKPASDVILESIEKGTAKRFPLQLRAGTYAVVGACGKNCDHVQLSLYGPGGALLIASPEKQPAVIIGGAAAVAGSYALELATPGCKVRVCQAGFVVARYKAGTGEVSSSLDSSRLVGAFLAHVSSERTHEEALATFAKLRELAPAALAEKRAIIQAVNLGARGVWHRLRIGPPMSKAEVHALCAALKAVGQSNCSVLPASSAGHKAQSTVSPNKPGPFDGMWLLSWRTEGCELPDGATRGRYLIAVSAGEMTRQNGRLHGKIASNGVAEWTVTAKIDGVQVRYMGNFSGTRASGRFSRADGSCDGTFTARKRN